MAVIFASGDDSHLNELTIHRTIASVPFGGRYRMLDFALSNLVNSGITKIGLIARNNYSSLMHHVRQGRDWDLSRKNSGIEVFPPFVLNGVNDMYRGKIDALYGIKNFFRNALNQYVVLGPSNIVANINLADAVQSHIDNKAHITVLAYNYKGVSATKNVIEVDENNRIIDMMVSVATNGHEMLVDTKMYIIEKDLLMRLIDEAYVRGKVEFEQEIIVKNIERLNIRAYKLDGYVAVIDSILGYFNANMDILDYNIRKEVFGKNGRIFTKVKDSAPTVYREDANVRNSLIADGCDIAGTVINSIVARGTRVEKGAVISNSVIMQKGVIMSNATVNYTITDKNVVVRENRQLSGSEIYPIVVVKDKIV